LSFVDELCAILLCGLYAYYVFHTPHWSVNRLFLITLGVFAFYLVYSLASHCNTKSAIVTDFIIQLKPYLAFFTVYAFAPELNSQMKKNIRFLTQIFAVYLFMIGVSFLFDDKILELLIHHPSRLATASTILAMLYLYCSDYTTKDKIIFLIILAIGLLSGRSKAYGFFVIATFIVFYVNNNFRLEFNWKNTLLFLMVTGLTMIVAWDKINLYFIQGGFGDGRETSDLYARMALYYFSTFVLMDYFPFGSGFATFATFASGQYYSSLYNQYGLDILYGLTENDPKFMADTYYPALAQFGIVGVFLFFLFWLTLTKRACRWFIPNVNVQQFVIAILIIGFFLIECTSDATITHNRGLFMMMLLALVLKDLKKNDLHVNESFNC
ncbi:MAG: hypothetical protein PUG10_00455, partial [Lachnospiraceae bacterium]|nr:hypothetical protein [Lachnospiraceae bacterium]